MAGTEIQGHHSEALENAVGTQALGLASEALEAAVGTQVLGIASETIEAPVGTQVLSMMTEVLEAFMEKDPGDIQGEAIRVHRDLQGSFTRTGRKVEL